MLEQCPASEKKRADKSYTPKRYMLIEPWIPCVLDTVLTDIYKKKRKLNDEYCIVGLPNVYDEFAASGDSQVVTYDTENKTEKQ